jgi:hypothetical protein
MTVVALVPVGDGARGRLGRALAVTGGVTLGFVLFALATTQLPGVRLHSPWSDDPYDAVVSFTMFFVPLLVAYGGVRVLLCRRDQPAVASRLRDLLRAGELAAAAVAVTSLADWVAVVLGVRRDQWGATGAALLLALGALSVASGAALWALRGVRTHATWLGAETCEVDPDWFDDAMAVAWRLLAAFRLDGFPLWAGLPRAVQRLLDGRFGLRRHRALAAAVLAVGFGLAIGAAEVLGEGPPSQLADAVWLLLLLLTAGSTGMFAFLLTAGSLLRVLRPLPGRSRKPSRGALVLAVAVSASVPVTLALRDQLPWVRGYADSGTPAQLLLRLVVVAAATAGVTALALARVRGRRQ